MMFAQPGASAPAVGPELALLHLNESSFDTRPTSFVNSAPSGLTFSNIGSDGSVGAIFWFGGEGPFGQGVNTQSSNNGGCAIVCNQLITAKKGMTHECFVMEFDNGRNVWDICENVADNPAWNVTLVALDQGDGTWKFMLEHNMPGFAGAATITAAFTPVTGGNGNWVITQWRDDGFFEVWANGVRLGVSALAYDLTIPNTKLAIFGSYRGTYAGGLYARTIGEFRLSATQRYTGSTATVPTARFTI